MVNLRLFFHDIIKLALIVDTVPSHAACKYAGGVDAVFSDAIPSIDVRGRIGGQLECSSLPLGHRIVLSQILLDFILKLYLR